MQDERSQKRDALLEIQQGTDILDETPCISIYTTSAPDFSDLGSKNALTKERRLECSTTNKSPRGLFLDTVFDTTHLMTIQEVHEDFDIARSENGRSNVIALRTQDDRPNANLLALRSGKHQVKGGDVIKGVVQRIHRLWREQGEDITISFHEARSALWHLGVPDNDSGSDSG
ncbi:hypothetical protein LTR85_009445 [Meristemomyces frigidus]|nr:hypothetical protein LTR85_009445 [Meristemomyces frigidus]